ncbi:acyltransferase family protein [Qipengyuania sp. CAU 1752]
MNKPAFIEKDHRYRADIDMLRAVAVVSVVLFHAGLSTVSGGFVGVDIFFVISGYLISKHLIEEAKDTGSVSILKFYQRRLRRIGPSLLTVLVTTTLVSLLLIFPFQFTSYLESLLASLSFVSNIYFWTQSGYFAAQSSTVPLLHTWSLAVEEQFYIIVPLLILIFARRMRQLTTVIWLIAATSLALSIWQSGLRPGASFYLLPTRMWELVTGTIVAQLVLSRNRFLDLLPPTLWAASGLLLIGLSLFLIDESMAFPGAVALLPCIGTAMVIIAGRDNVPAISMALSSRPVLHIGLISYSLYLWHWPVIVFWRFLFPDNDGWQYSAAVIALSYVLAALTWKFVELPTRSSKTSLKKIVLSLAAGATAMVSVAAVGLVTAGLPVRFADSVVRYAAAANDLIKVPGNCRFGMQECQLGKEGRYTKALIGDSHAGALSRAFDTVWAERGQTGLLLHQNACPSLLGYRPEGRSAIFADRCLDRNTDGFRKLAGDRNIDEVFLANSNYGEITSEDLARTIEFFHAAGKRVTVVHGLPLSRNLDSVPIGLARSEAFGLAGPVLRIPDEPIEGLKERYRDNTIRFVDLSRLFCDEKACKAQIRDDPIFSDGLHITARVSDTYVTEFLRSEI